MKLHRNQCGRFLFGPRMLDSRTVVKGILILGFCPWRCFVLYISIHKQRKGLRIDTASSEFDPCRFRKFILVKEVPHIIHPRNPFLSFAIAIKAELFWRTSIPLDEGCVDEVKHVEVARDQGELL